MSIRLHELAKELKVTSKELIDKLKAMNVTVKSHMSVLEDDDVKRLRQSYKTPAAPTKTAVAEETPKSVKTGPEKKTGQAPSIESVKKEFLLQRLGTTKPAQAPADNKRAGAAGAPSAPISTPPRIRRTPEQTPLVKDRAPVQDIKKVMRVPDTASSTVKPTAAPAASSAPVTPPPAKKIEMPAMIVVKDLAVKLSLRPNDLIQRLIKLNVFASMNQAVTYEIATKVALEFGYETERPKEVAVDDKMPGQEPKGKATLVTRAPIVTFMGHVDHGKTSLLDAIRKTKVAAKEAGGITQHIGAYEVFLPKGAVTFLDTPGHEAFTAMRARGAKLTDVVVLVVAADDGVMPQTVEAIHHAKAAEVPIIVAINKIDLSAANPERVKKELMEHGLMPEEWGGKTIMVGVSAKTGKGIDELLEFLVLESDLLELKADPTAPAQGIVVEAELSRDSGVLANVLVQDGTLRIGDVLIAGDYFGKVRAMINDRGQRIREALPSMPVEILGLPGVPRAGDRFYVVKDERKAKEIFEEKEAKGRSGPGMHHTTLEHLYEDIKSGKVQELKLILKSDVQGSVEALTSTLAKIPSKNVRLHVIHSGTGDISESDVMLAAASDAVVIGFHVGIASTARETAEKEGVDVRFYEIIYEVKTAIEKAMEGLLQPELKEVFVGEAEVRQVFKVSKIGTIAGCSVQKGKIVRNFLCRVMRGGQKVREGKVESLKRFKDDAREVLEGFECGIGVSNFDEILPGDRIVVYEIQKQARKLE